MHHANSLEAIGSTPLIELPEISPDDGAKILLKLESANPTGSMKDRMALAMIETAEREGILEPGQRVVERTGGSTGSSLAFVCTVKGYPLSLIVADCFSMTKINTMRALGADVEVIESPDGTVYPGVMDDMEERVREIEAETNAYYTDQTNNPHQLEGYRTLGRELLNDCPEITDFVHTVGTGGSSMGVAEVLASDAASVTVTLVEPEESPAISAGKLGSHNVEGISVLAPPPLLVSDLYDRVMTVPEVDARQFMRRLAATEGILAGPSTGINLAAGVEVARERSPDDAVVTIACDTGLKYLMKDHFGL